MQPVPDECIMYSMCTVVHRRWRLWCWCSYQQLCGCFSSFRWWSELVSCASVPSWPHHPPPVMSVFDGCSSTTLSLVNFSLQSQRTSISIHPLTVAATSFPVFVRIHPCYQPLPPEYRTSVSPPPRNLWILSWTTSWRSWRRVEGWSCSEEKTHPLITNFIEWANHSHWHLLYLYWSVYELHYNTRVHKSPSVQ